MHLMSSKQNDTPSSPQRVLRLHFRQLTSGPGTRTHTTGGPPARTHTYKTTGRLLHSFRRLPTHYAYARLTWDTPQVAVACCCAATTTTTTTTRTAFATASSNFLCNFLRSCQNMPHCSHRPAYLLASTNGLLSRHCNVFLGLENLLLLHFLKILFKYVNNCKRFGSRAYVPAI